MLDPNKLIGMLTNLTNMSQSMQQSLTQNFMSGASQMNVNDMANMEKMMSMMAKMNEQTSSGMGELMKDLQQDRNTQVNQPQENQQQTEGKAGFPKEAMDFFSAMQKKK